MTKLNRQEIEDAYIEEYGEIEIPQKALSRFMFEIEENIDDLLADIKAQGNYSKQTCRIDIETGDDFVAEEGDCISSNQWFLKTVFENLDDAEYELEDPDFYSSAKIHLVDRDHMIITTAWSGFTYDILQKRDGGCVVYFDGPFNGLLNQNLLPTMTYEPYTLKGMFYSEDGKELTPYMDINEYCQMREQKNKTKNNQDYYTNNYINRFFNNEISLYKKWEPKAEETFLEIKKKLMRIRLNKLKTREKKSGVVFADDLAAAKISGKEKRTITPELARKLKKEYE